MIKEIRQKIYNLLIDTQKYTGTDNVYLFKGGFWMVVYQIVSLSTGLILYIAFARLLSPYEYGIYQYVISVVGTLGLLQMDGINNALIRSVAKGFDGSLRTALKEKIKWSSLGSLLLFVIAGYYYIKQNTTYAFLFIISAAFFSFYSNFDIYLSFLNGKKDFQKKTIYFTFSQIFYITCLVTALYLKTSLFTLVFLFFASQTIAGVLFYSRILPLVKNNKTEEGMVNYGRNLSFLGGLGVISANIDNLIVYHFLGPVELAVYSFATLPVEQIRTFFKIIKPLGLPKFSERSFEELKKSAYKRGFLLLLTAIAVIIAYIFVAPYFYRFLFPQYEESIFFSRIYSFMLLGIVIVIPSTIFIAQKKTKKMYQISITEMIIRILLLWILTANYGMLGAVLAVVTTRLIMGVFHYLILK